MKSILFSLFQHFWTLSFGDAIADAFGAVRGVIRALLSRSKDARTLGRIRTDACEKCEFYDAKWKTCGTPGETMGAPEGVRMKIGCWCYLPLANRDPEKDCWARSNIIHSPDGSPVGWPDVLRPPKSNP